MSAPMRIFRFFRRIRPLLAYSPGYTFRSNLKRFITVGVIQSPVAIKLSCESKVKIEEPDASKLSREYLIKASSISSADYALVLLTQTAMALQQAEIEYKEALEAVTFLLEFKLNILGDVLEEARIWDLILEGRQLLHNAQKKKDDLTMLHNSVVISVNATAEVAYMTGGEVVATSANDKLHKVERLLREVRLQSEDAKDKLTQAELKTIEVEGKYAEEHAEELEREKQKVIEEVQKVVKGQEQEDSTNETNATNKTHGGEKKTKTNTKVDSQTDDFIEILDKWQSKDEDSAKNI